MLQFWDVGASIKFARKIISHFFDRYKMYSKVPWIKRDQILHTISKFLIKKWTDVRENISARRHPWWLMSLAFATERSVLCRLHRLCLQWLQRLLLVLNISYKKSCIYLDGSSLLQVYCSVSLRSCINKNNFKPLFYSREFSNVCFQSKDHLKKKRCKQKFWVIYVLYLVVV